MATVATVVLDYVLNPATLVGALLYALVVLLLARLAVRALRFVMAQVLARDTRGVIDRTVASFMLQLATAGLYLLALTFYAHLIPALRAVGTALLAGVSIVSVVVGLAAQNTLSNLIAGLALLLYRPFQVGDLVQVTAPTGLETGRVERLTLGYTVLRTADHRRIVVPNSAMSSQVTVNLTDRTSRALTTVTIGIGSEADLDQARQILLTLAQTHPQVHEVVGCLVTQVGKAGVVLTLRVWCADEGTAPRVASDLYEQAKKRFDQERIALQ